MVGKVLQYPALNSVLHLLRHKGIREGFCPQGCSQVSSSLGSDLDSRVGKDLFCLSEVFWFDYQPGFGCICVYISIYIYIYIYISCSDMYSQFHSKAYIEATLPNQLLLKISLFYKAIHLVKYCTSIHCTCREIIIQVVALHLHGARTGSNAMEFVASR